MVLRSGIDLVEIDRIRDVYQRHGQRFLDRMFTAREQRYCLTHRDPSPHLAARFAAKEAVAKMLGVGIGAELSWLDIEVLREESGQPRLHLAESIWERFEIDEVSLSITHSRDYAAATAICTQETNE
jgi:holo-[acyl-carrier protein] synthase